MKKQIILTNFEIENILIGRNFRGQNFYKNSNIPIKLVWAIKVALAELERVYAVYDKTRLELNDSFISDNKATLNEDGTATINSEYLGEYIEQLKALGEISSEITILTIGYDDIQNASSLTVEDLDVLDFMLEY